jgi:hypothetical protein
MNIRPTKISSPVIYSRKETAGLRPRGRLRGFRLNKSNLAALFFRAEDIDKLLADVDDEEI